MFQQKIRAGGKVLLLSALFFFLASALGALPTSADETAKRIRVGLIEPGASLSSCQITFEDEHGIYFPKEKYRYTFDAPLLTVEKASTYTLKRLSGQCELSRETLPSLSDFDASEYPSRVPIIVGSDVEKFGVRLLNTDGAFGSPERLWDDSVVGYVDAVGFYEGEELKFIVASHVAVLKSQAGNPFLFYNSYFRGGFSVFNEFPDAGSFFPINDLDLESYLYGVVPREMPTAWHKEALKAQAVCARTYAVSSLGNFRKHGYDVAPTIISQVYGGMSAEDANGKAAVDATRREELFHGTDRVQAFFHSSNGGFCAGSEDVFSTKLPYFRPKPDPYSLKITKPWYVQVSSQSLGYGLANIGIQVGEVKNLEIVSVNPSRIVEKVRVHGSDGTAEISGDRLRSILGGNNVKSLYFTLVDRVDTGNAPVVSAQGGQAAKEALSVLTGEGVKQKEKSQLRMITADGSLQALDARSVLSASGTKNDSKPSAKPKAKEEGLAYAGASQGDTGMIIEGYGWGHNLGMSQWGAKVMADEGHDYQDILQFYYEGTEIRKN